MFKRSLSKLALAASLGICLAAVPVSVAVSDGAVRMSVGEEVQAADGYATFVYDESEDGAKKPSSEKSSTAAANTGKGSKKSSSKTGTKKSTTGTKAGSGTSSTKAGAANSTTRASSRNSARQTGSSANQKKQFQTGVFEPGYVPFIAGGFLMVLGSCFLGIKKLNR